LVRCPPRPLRKGPRRRMVSLKKWKASLKRSNKTMI
jgi:hypothetical protein